MVSRIRFTASSVKRIAIYSYGFSVAETIDCRAAVYGFTTSRIDKAKEILAVEICFTQFGNIGYRRCYIAIVCVIIRQENAFVR